jgi:hypothetical protein
VIERSGRRPSHVSPQPCPEDVTGTRSHVRENTVAYTTQNSYVKKIDTCEGRPALATPSGGHRQDEHATRSRKRYAGEYNRRLISRASAA